jgi:hypothetical protein
MEIKYTFFTFALYPLSMHYIDLKEIGKEHIYGTWDVLSRHINAASQTNVFSDVRIIEMESEGYRSINGKERAGNWDVIRENEVIYNPQLKFFIEGVQVGKAIITRLVAKKLFNDEVYNLTLYFNSGLELILQKRSA